MPVGYEKIDYDKLEFILRQSQDVHSAFELEDVLLDGVDAHFVGRVVGMDGRNVYDRVSKFWVLSHLGSLDGYFVLPRNYKLTNAYSRKAFAYPQIHIRTVLPDVRKVGDEASITLYIGAENGPAAGNGLICFALRSTATITNQLYAIASPQHGATELNISVALPYDFNQAVHYYRIVHSRAITLFIVDNRVRAIAVQCREGDSIKVKENVLPYSIMLVPQLPATLRALLEWSALTRTKVASDDLYAPISPAWFRVSDGKDVMPLQLPLYLDDNDTRMMGYSIGSGSVTSHPFPIWGYTNRTLLFMSNQSGTLDIQVYTLSRNWRSYDTVSVSANTLVKYRFQDAFPLARVVFTPGTYPAIINEAEIDLS